MPLNFCRADIDSAAVASLLDREMKVLHQRTYSNAKWIRLFLSYCICTSGI